MALEWTGTLAKCNDPLLSLTLLRRHNAKGRMCREQTPNTRTIIKLKHLPTHCDSTYQHFGIPPFTRDPDSVISQTAASVTHTYTAASHRHLLSSYPLENLLWQLCTRRHPPFTHTTLDITGLPLKNHNTSALPACAHSSSVKSRPLMNLTAGLTE